MSSPSPRPEEPEQSHLTGFSYMRDEKTGKDIHNSWDIRDKGHELETRVGPTDETAEKFKVTSDDPAVIKHHRDVKREAERADYYRRRVLEAETLEKPKSKPKPRPKAKRACPECEESGKTWVGEVEEVCDRCEGRGWI